MVSLVRANSDNRDFVRLVSDLDSELAKADGADHSFYAQFNTLDKIKYVVLAYENDSAVGCGAIKKHSVKAMEVKRLYVRPDNRGKGIASKILSELESWAADLSFAECVLETGKRQPDAIRLYEKNGYQRISNYGQYAGVDNSVCFKKEIIRAVQSHIGNTHTE